MENKNKKAIKAIVNLSITNPDRLGDILTPILFENKKCALFLSRQNKNVEILVPVNNKKQEQFQIFWLLTEFISLMHDLENKHLIYVIQQAEDHFSEFYYQGKKDYSQTQINSTIKINDSCTLRVEKDGQHAIYENGNQILLGIIGPSAIYNDLMYFLNSIVYPTSGLKKYIKRGFKSEESYLSIRANRISKISICIAIFIALFSPFISVWWSNKHGISRIDETQYQGLMNIINTHIDSTLSMRNILIHDQIYNKQKNNQYHE